MRRTPLPRYIAMLTRGRSRALDRPPAQVCALNLILMPRGFVQEVSGEGVNVFWRYSVLHLVVSLFFPFSCEVWGMAFPSCTFSFFVKQIFQHVIVRELRYLQLLFACADRTGEY